MSDLMASDKGSSNFKPVPAGMHLARCYRVIDLGTQKSEYKGDVKLLNKVMFQFEVHGEADDGTPLKTEKGEPMSISKTYTLSLGDKATMNRDLSTWRGKAFTDEEKRGFSLKNLLGVWAMLSVVKSTGQNGKEYTNIEAINPVPKAMKANLPEGHNKPALYSIMEHDEELYQSFSDWIKNKIADSPEYKSKINKKAAPKGASFEDMEDDIPFLFDVSSICDTLGSSKSLHRIKHGPKALHILRANQTNF